jgi:hypothetical protein
MVRYLFDPASDCLRGYSDTHEVRVLAWPRLMAYRRPIASTAWKAWQPDFPLAAEAAEDGAIGAFLAGIPVEVRRVVGRFRSHHWELMRWCALAGHGGESLCAANPALAFMMALSRQFRRPPAGSRPSALPAVLAFTKQRRLLGWLGFPPTEPVRRVLARILPGALTIADLKALRRQLTRGGIPPGLAHVPHINADVMQLAAQGVLGCLSAGMIAALSNPAEDSRSTSMARRVVAVVALWRRLRPADGLPLFHSAEQVRVVQRELAAARREARASHASLEFPPPPVPGTAGILPLTTRLMLADEGCRQHNCVASYGKSAAAGRVAIYRVLAPERCTLSLVKRRGVWVMGQIKAACNKDVRTETRAAIQAWLESSRRPVTETGAVTAVQADSS